jgi:hypothetical protein
MLRHIRIYWKDAVGLYHDGGDYRLWSPTDRIEALDALLRYAERGKPFFIRVNWEGLPAYWAHAGDVITLLDDAVRDDEDRLFESDGDGGSSKCEEVLITLHPDVDDSVLVWDSDDHEDLDAKTW